jgi:hypothetical protein
MGACGAGFPNASLAWIRPGAIRVPARSIANAGGRARTHRGGRTIPSCAPWPTFHAALTLLDLTRRHVLAVGADRCRPLSSGGRRYRYRRKVGVCALGARGTDPLAGARVCARRHRASWAATAPLSCVRRGYRRCGRRDRGSGGCASPLGFREIVLHRTQPAVLMERDNPTSVEGDIIAPPAGRRGSGPAGPSAAYLLLSPR